MVKILLKTLTSFLNTLTDVSYLNALTKVGMSSSSIIKDYFWWPAQCLATDKATIKTSSEALLRIWLTYLKTKGAFAFSQCLICCVLYWSKTFVSSETQIDFKTYSTTNSWLIWVNSSIEFSQKVLNVFKMIKLKHMQRVSTVFLW